MIPDIEKIARQSLLFDFYGQLLTQKQRNIVEMYTQENLSLAEISEELGVSRQAVHDALRKGMGSLEKYEEKLGLVARSIIIEDAVEEIDGRILALIEDLESEESDRKKGSVPAPEEGRHREKTVEELKIIKSIIDGLEDE